MPRTYEEWKKLHDEVNECYLKGDKEECRKQTLHMLEQAKDAPAWIAFWRGYTLWRFNGDLAKAEAYFAEAVKRQPDNALFLARLAIILRRGSRLDEALDKALKAVEKDPGFPFAWDVLGNVHRDQKKYAEAIAAYSKALALDNRFATAWNNLGYVYYEIWEYAKATEAYKKALQMNNNLVVTWNNLGMAYNRGGNPAKAKEAFAKALALKDRPIAARPKQAASDQTEATSSLASLKGLVAAIHQKNDQTKSIDKLLRHKDKVEKEFDEFITGPSRFDPSRSFFLGLRKWNSYTPALPSGDERSIGGGYFLYLQGVGTVVDPGFNFIENFCAAGGRLDDIRNIVITHDHNDHTNDLESLLTLLYRRAKRVQEVAEDRRKGKPVKRDVAPHAGVTLYLNLGAMKKFSGMLDLRAGKYPLAIRVMNAGTAFEKFDERGVALTVLPAYHNETLSRDYSVGLCFDVKLRGLKKCIVFTGDTGLFPPPTDGQKDQGMKVNIDGMQICARYREVVPNIEGGIDVLIPHLGSVKEEEFALPPVSHSASGTGGGMNAEERAAYSRIFYDNHLGLLGCMQVLHALRPKVAFVSEFGEELRPKIQELAEFIQEVCAVSIPGRTVLPCGLHLLYDLATEEVYDILKKRFAPVADVVFDQTEADGKGNFYYTTVTDKNALKKVKAEYEALLAAMRRNGGPFRKVTKRKKA